MNQTVLLIGTFDTKGMEYAFVRDRLHSLGLRTLHANIGVMGDSDAIRSDITAEEIAAEAGAALPELRAKGDRGFAMQSMGRGMAKLARRLYEEGRFSAVFGMGGTGGSSVVGEAMRALPFGVPKVLVSTVASGDTRPIVGTRDITLIPSVVDVAGINSISRIVLTRAAGAVAGMINAGASKEAADKPIVGITMFGNTTKCVDRCRQQLTEKGYEVLVFHCTGTGGRTMEELVKDGLISAVLDITTTEWADEIAGGVFAAGPNRLSAPGEVGIPHLIVPGCVDMVNFGPKETVPARYADRQFHVWNANVTLMRTNVEENRRMGEIFAETANRAIGPRAFLLPLKGVSILDSEGGEFWQPEANQALYDALRQQLAPGIRVAEADLNINDPAFADKAVSMFLELIAEKERTNR
ncbi:Tm-1-like ATP-binding domain-containing protein [Paenibacillus sp.]|uniref:Tm-1-like ATP-binding domain-containing protein n=1 Tax=Paenibacillus sp. TaxID=58172 RepID=UPI002D2D36B7|nr:Tm-1-like ATP-binding domain-containing protein [Paenibacillus sp.]HZG83379.1 Tm-1-like ATP-binding domain-containing protein [Paenibacillus sp.]